MKGGDILFEKTQQTSAIDASERHGEEVEDLLSQRPNWLVRNGNWIFLAITTIMVILAALLKFPGRVVGEAVITFKNPSVTLVSRSSGKIQGLFVANHQKVPKDQPICVIENPTSYEDITLLKTLMNRVDSALRAGNVDHIPVVNLPHRFGEMQGNYAQLITAISNYNYFLEKDPHTKRIQLVKQQLSYLESLDEQFKSKQEMLDQKLELEKKKFAVDSVLNDGKVIAATEFDASHSRYLDQKLAHQDNIFKEIENKKLQSTLRREVADLESDRDQRGLQLKQVVLENMREIDGLISGWEHQYLIKAPINGSVLFLKFWKENQFVQEAEPVVLIMPEFNEYVCRVKVPVEGSGKIKTDQSALIKLTAYPYNEYGTVHATITSLPQVSVDGFYYLDVALDEGLVTSRKKVIPDSPLLEGQVEILTDPKNIFQKLFEKILSTDLVEAQ